MGRGRDTYCIRSVGLSSSVVMLKSQARGPVYQVIIRQASRVGIVPCKVLLTCEFCRARRQQPLRTADFSAIGRTLAPKSVVLGR